MGYYIIFLMMGLLLFSSLWFYYRSSREKVAVSAMIAGASFIIAVITLSIGMFAETADTEVWNGKVTSKEKEQVSCSHSYSCNCRSVQSCSGSGKDRSCTSSTQCDTCYEHNHDFDWVVHTTIGGKEIDRIDRQGVSEPPRWTSVKTNDPVADTHTFTNYVKAAKNNVLNREGTKISYAMPTYPANIYDYYNIDRAVTADNAVSNLKAWDAEISKALIDLGTTKQVNLVLVFTKNPQDYSEQLNAVWLGGKKNDVIVVIGTKDGKTAEWVNVLSWTKREDFKVELRDAIMAQELTPVGTVQVIASNIAKKFERRHMAEFEYLKYDIEPSEGFVIASFILFFVPLIGFVFANYRSNNRRNSFSTRFKR